MPKEIRLNAFEMNGVAHQSPGLWWHPRDRSRDYRRVGGWIELARTHERGLFDGVFLEKAAAWSRALVRPSLPAYGRC